MNEFDSLAIGVVSFIVGVVTGYSIRYFTEKKMKKESKWAFLDTNKKRINFLLVTVTILWGLSMIVDIVSITYETSPFLYGLMGAIVGYFFYVPKHE